MMLILTSFLVNFTGIIERFFIKNFFNIIIFHFYINFLNYFFLLGHLIYFFFLFLNFLNLYKNSFYFFIDFKILKLYFIKSYAINLNKNRFDFFKFNLIIPNFKAINQLGIVIFIIFNFFIISFVNYFKCSLHHFFQ